MPCSTLRRHTTCVPARLRSALSGSDSLQKSELCGCAAGVGFPELNSGFGGLGAERVACVRGWQLLSFATNNLPDGSGFGLGFYLGLRYI